MRVALRPSRHDEVCGHPPESYARESRNDATGCACLTAVYRAGPRIFRPLHYRCRTAGTIAPEFSCLAI